MSTGRPGRVDDDVVTTATAKKTTAARKPAAVKTAPAVPVKKPADAIEFHGRFIRVTRPTEGQIVAWDRIAQRYSNADTSEIGGDEALRVYNRLINVIESVIVLPVDRDWVEDLLASGEKDLKDVAQVVSLTCDLYFGTGAREAPRNGPVSKARRR